MSSLTDLCKEVLELDEKATKGPLCCYVEKGRPSIRDHADNILVWNVNADDGVTYAHYRTSAPLLAKACLRMKEALEFYAEQGPAMACGACIEDGGDKARKALEEMK